MDYFFNPLPLRDFLNKLKDKNLGDTDFYVLTTKKIIYLCRRNKFLYSY
ncbi:hypothetical protein EZS27_017516 [termite gut metagenome]|uniref:Uncharacterized protein n=1 Tax=termite gut metagenome TaxID=433724 RepID=A0A5J4RKN2_9ZZZZ